MKRSQIERIIANYCNLSLLQQLSVNLGIKEESEIYVDDED